MGLKYTKPCQICGKNDETVFLSYKFKNYICSDDYHLWLSKTPKQPDKICDVCKLASHFVHYSKKFNQNLCPKHYQHLNLKGKIVEKIIRDKVCEICGLQGKRI